MKIRSSQFALAQIGRDFGDVTPMARLTGTGGGLVKQNIFALYGLFQRVASRAGHILVPALERKRGLLMVKEGRPPLITVMTRGAIAPSRSKLVRVWVFVALTASTGRSGEANVFQRQLHIRRFMTIGAPDGAMRAHECKARPRMIKFRQILPFLRGMAGLATKCLARRVPARHALGELAMMNVLMATGTT